MYGKFRQLCIVWTAQDRLFLEGKLHITSMIQEDIPADECRFEFLKNFTSEQLRFLSLYPLEQLVVRPIFYILDCGFICSGYCCPD